MTCCFQTAKGPTVVPPTDGIVWPLRPSSNRRYMVDSAGVPVFLLATADQSILGTINETSAAAWADNRKAKHINGSWVQCYNNRANFGAVEINGPPFIPMTDITKPSEAYFAHVDRVLNILKDRGIMAFLGPLGMNGYGDATDDGGAYINNPLSAHYAWGRFLGNRYKNQGNIIWQFGNDLNNTATASINNKFLETARGIRETDTNQHPMTLQIHPTPNLSSDAFGRGWATYINLNSVYSYRPTYFESKKGYQVNQGPAMLFETIYEQSSENNQSCRHGYCGTPRIMRSAGWWGILGGSTAGYMFGNEGLFAMSPANVASGLNTAPQQQLVHIWNTFTPRRWYDLAPDFNHVIATAGYGAFPNSNEWSYQAGYVAMATVTATTVASTPDGALMIAYMERPRALTVDMSRLSASAIATWINPETGGAISGGGPFTGSHVFTPPARTGTGGETADWVLVLE